VTIHTIVEQFVRALRRSAPMLFIETVGGAVSRVDAEDAAYPHRDELMSLTAIARRNDVADDAADEAWVRAFKDAVRPESTGGVYVNYPDADLAGWSHAYHRDNYPRLVEVKRRYDAGDFFRFPQSIVSVVSRLRTDEAHQGGTRCRLSTSSS
jgi:hypothetical protein